jgi:hypothetical protein
MNISSLQVKKALIKKGYIWNPVVNIVGIRNLDVGSSVTNLFDDTITLSYILNDKPIFRDWPCTTDPGKKTVLQYQNVKGVARLVEGQYINSYALGLHKGIYEALVQVKPVKVWRDANKDLVYDENTAEEGLFGINIHHAGISSIYVNDWSAGCQVFKNQIDFNQFILIIKSLKIKKFTYTLISSKDII